MLGKNQIIDSFENSSVSTLQTTMVKKFCLKPEEGDHDV